MFGYLYLAEKKAAEDLNNLLGQLKGSWAKKIARLADPAATGKELNQNAAVYTTFVADIKRVKDKVPVMHLRGYIEALKKLVELSKDIPAIPKPAPPPKPAPAPVAPPEPEALPPVPPGIKCPQYSRASAFPKDWHDPAAGARYLARYPDVKKAIDLKRQPSALWHYRCYGKGENRTWGDWGQQEKKKMVKLYALLGALALVGMFGTLSSGGR